MAYRFMDSGDGDLRARRTRTHLKEAFLETLAKQGEKRARITVKELADAAEINRKTFYLHYSSIEEMTYQIAEDIARTVGESFTGDLEHDIECVYEFLSTDDSAVQILLTDSAYTSFQRHLYGEIFTRGAFGEIAAEKGYPAYISGYFESIIGIYHSYMNTHPEETDLTSLAAKACKMVLFGIRGGRAKAVWKFLYQIYTALTTSQSILNNRQRVCSTASRVRVLSSVRGSAYQYSIR